MFFFFSSYLVIGTVEDLGDEYETEHDKRKRKVCGCFLLQAHVIRLFLLFLKGRHSSIEKHYWFRATNIHCWWLHFGWQDNLNVAFED